MKEGDTVRLIKKKNEMKRCVGCGFCCMEMPCSSAMEIHGPVRECPELVWNGERYRCRIFKQRSEQGLANEFCCHPSNTWRLDVKQRKEDEKNEKGNFNDI